MKPNMICVIYIDDTIFAGPSAKDIDNEVKLLGTKQNSEEKPFEFRDGGEVSAFLGIKTKRASQSEFYLSQPGLISKVLKAAGMTNCNPNTTLDPLLGLDVERKYFNEKWEYVSVIGILMYLANNTRPDIAHAVHACANYSHNPKQTHTTTVKHISRYLKGTENKGMVIKPNRIDAFHRKRVFSP